MMRLPIVKHEDDRRSLVEWIADYPIKCCKVLVMKQDGVVGAHYHKNKADTFYLLKGSGDFIIDKVAGKIEEGDCMRAEKGERHTFRLKAGSILLEASTTPYDKEDEISSFE